MSPENKVIFRAHANKYIQELEELDQWIKQEISSIPKLHRHLITNHDAFQYYANAYDLAIPKTLIGMSTEEKANSQSIEDLVKTIKISKCSEVILILLSGN